MGVFHEAIPESMIKWILDQKMFCVATAPLAGPTRMAGGPGHVNVSPKGGPYFGIASPTQFWYMDLTGSGNETISHLNEPGNGRITIMFNAFEGPPKIVRLFGYGTVLENGTSEFDTFVTKHEVTLIPGTRTIIIVDIHQVGSSCGFSVPYYDFKDHRPILNDHFKKKEDRFLAGKKEESMDHYWAFKNAYSMDGLPGMKRGLKAGKELSVAPIKKMVGPLKPLNQELYGRVGNVFGLLHLILVLVLGMALGFGFATAGPFSQVNLQDAIKPMLKKAMTRIAAVSVSLPSPAQIVKR